MMITSKTSHSLQYTTFSTLVTIHVTNTHGDVFARSAPQKDHEPKALEDLIQLLLINNEMRTSRRLHRSQSDETRAS